MNETYIYEDVLQCVLFSCDSEETQARETTSHMTHKNRAENHNYFISLSTFIYRFLI